MIWMGSLYLYVFFLVNHDMVDVTVIPGWLIFWYSRRIPRATDSEIASRPYSPVCLLPESIRSDA